jgi:hypothetical protein
MCKQHPDQRPKYNINWMMPRVPELAESKYHSDTLWRYKQYELPVMNSLFHFLLLIQLSPLLWTPVMLSKMSTPTEYFVLCVQPQREEAEACKCRTRVSAWKAHLRFFDLGCLACADLAGSVIPQITPWQSLKAT